MTDFLPVRSEFCGHDGLQQWRIYDRTGNALCYAETSDQCAQLVDAISSRLLSAPLQYELASLAGKLRWRIRDATAKTLGYTFDEHQAKHFIQCCSFDRDIVEVDEMDVDRPPTY